MNTKTFLLSCSLVDLLEPARNLSLETQKDKNNLSELCNTFAYRFGGLQDVEDTNENHIATKDDVLLLHVNKLLHCASWSTKSQNQVDSLIKIFRQFENMPSLKGINIINLEEQYSQLMITLRDILQITVKLSPTKCGVFCTM